MKKQIANGDSNSRSRRMNTAVIAIVESKI